MKCKYYTEYQFKEIGFDEDSKEMSLMHLNISSLSYHIDELTNLLKELYKLLSNRDNQKQDNHKKR